MAGAAVFYLAFLPAGVPRLLPRLRPLLGDSVALFAGLAPDGEGAAAAAAEDAARRALEPALEAVVPLGAVDRDTCTFLFLIYATMCTCLAGLVASRALWRLRLALVATLALPPFAAAALALTANGMFGGVETGGDPVAGVCTLAFTVVYHFGGGVLIHTLLRPYL